MKIALIIIVICLAVATSAFNAAVPANSIEYVSTVGAEMNSKVTAPLEKDIGNTLQAELASLREKLLKESKANLVASPQTYDAAIRVTDAWLAALEEREGRKNEISNTKGNKKKRKFAVNADKNNWGLRAASIMANLDTLYSQFRELKGQSIAAVTNPAPPEPTAPHDRPTDGVPEPMSGDLTTLSGIKYEAIALKRVDPDGLLILHKNGVAKVLFTDLPKGVRIKYGYDAQKARGFQAAQKMAQAAEAKKQAEAEEHAKHAERIKPTGGELDKKFLGLKAFKVLQANFSKRENILGRKEPVIKLTIQNDTDQSVKRAYFRGVLSSEGRAIPWVDETFNYEIAGGVEPHEKQTWHLSPNMFSKWGEVDVPSDARFEVTVIRLDGPDGKDLFGDADFGGRDEKRPRK